MKMNALLLVLLAALLGTAGASSPCDGVKVELPQHVTVSQATAQQTLHLRVLEEHVGGNLNTLSLLRDSPATRGVCKCSDASCTTNGYDYECEFPSLGSSAAAVTWILIAEDLQGNAEECGQSPGSLLVLNPSNPLKDVVVQKRAAFNAPAQRQNVEVRVYNNSLNDYGKLEIFEEIPKTDSSNAVVLSRIMPSDEECKCADFASSCRLAGECFNNSKLVFGATQLPFPSDFVVEENDPAYSTVISVSAGQVKLLDYYVQDASSAHSLPSRVQLAGCDFSLRVLEPLEGKRFGESENAGVHRFQVLKDDRPVYSPRIEVNLKNPDGTLQPLTLSTSYHPAEGQQFYQGPFLLGQLGRYELEVKLNNEFCPAVSQKVEFYKSAQGTTAATPGFDSASLLALALFFLLFSTAKALNNHLGSGRK